MASDIREEKPSSSEDTNISAECQYGFKGMTKPEAVMYTNCQEIGMNSSPVEKKVDTIASAVLNASRLGSSMFIPITERMIEQGDIIPVIASSSSLENESDAVRISYHRAIWPSPTTKATPGGGGIFLQDEVPVEAMPSTSIEDRESGRVLSNGRSFFAKFLAKHRLLILLFIWLVLTGWWIAGLILHRHDFGWLIPFLLWLAVTVRFITLFVSTRYPTKLAAFIWIRAVYNPFELIPKKFRVPLSAAGTIAVFLVGTFVTEESEDNTRANRAVSLFGLLVFIGLFYATSRDRKKIKWRTVIVGMLAQYLLALFVLRTKAGFDVFNFIAFLARSLLGFAADGTSFLTSKSALGLGYFLLNVIPPIIFFIAFVNLLYYWGWLQWAIAKFATAFFYTMGVSGAEAVVAAASPFVGQGESAMLIKPFIPHLTSAELHQVMTSGFATIAGSVLAAYIGLGISPVALISSCVMSIPASLAISKLRYPETEESLTAGKIIVPRDTDEKPANGLHAFAIGSFLGIKVGGMIISTLLCILAILGLVNALLAWWGRYINIENPELSVELICSYLFYPVAFLIGVERNGDLLKVAKLIGTKIVANEFVAFSALVSDPTYASLSTRSRLIATYALCGFGNLSSVGIQIGVLSQLAPEQSARVAEVAVSALISGVVSTLTSASIAGMVITDTAMYTKVGAGA